VDIRDLLAGDVRLSSPPELFLRLNEVMDSPLHTLSDAARLIELDPGISARLLHLVNSAYYGFPSRVTSIAQAAGIVGFQELRDLVLATLVVDRFCNLPNRLLSMREFWTHSVKTGLYARFLARRHTQARFLGSVFICGLLHEIGRLVLYHHIPDVAADALCLALEENSTETAAQRRLLGFDHYQLGALLTSQWRLPELIVASIHHHDTPEQAEGYATESYLVLLSTHLAQFGMNWDDAVRPNWEACWYGAGLPQTLAEEVGNEVDQAFAPIFQMLYRA
jgi:HD-like signal output (HDOD) protein